jgi:pimeloyl-ACP methyl ester carboxylesterase
MSIAAPALIFSLQAVVRLGWSAVQVVDEFHDRSQDPTRWVTERATAALSAAGRAERTLVVAKSVSTRASAFAAERGFPAVWLTPLLDDDASVEGLRRRTAPALLVGGTADPSWDGAVARELSGDVLELEGADHGLGRAGDDPLDTLENLKRVVQAVTEFAATI